MSANDDARISEIRALHFQDNDDPFTCYECDREWPCYEAYVAARLDALTAEAADVARENEALIEEVKAAGEQIAALAAERDDWRARPGRRGAMASERCDHSVRDAAMGGAIGLGLLAAGLGAPWAVAGMVAGGLLGWWLARRPAAQEGRDASE